MPRVRQPRDTRIALALAISATALLLLAPAIMATPPTPAPDSNTADPSAAGSAATEATAETDAKPLAAGSFHGLVIVPGNVDDGASLAEKRRAVAEEMRELLAERLASSPFAPPAETPEKVMLDNGMERMRLGVGGISFAVIKRSEDGKSVSACVHGTDATAQHLEAEGAVEADGTEIEAKTEWVEQ